MLAILIPALLLVGLAPTRSVSAVSPGCAVVNTFNNTSGAFEVPGIFEQGETLTVSAHGGTFDVLFLPNPATSVSSYTYTFPATGPYNVELMPNPISPLIWSIECGPATSPDTANTVTWLHFTDGRVNDHDGAETAAVYCEEGGMTVYAVIDSVGYLAFKVTKAELAVVPAKPEKNTLIKSGLGVSLYRLTTGELQINAPDNYVFVWNGCPA